MASPGDTLKNSLFGQLKSYSNAVHDVFEQRIARPLLAFKRDLSRPISEARVPTNHESLSSSNRTCQESSLSSSPLEIIDVDTNNSFKSLFDKVRNSLSPSIKRRTSENPTNVETKNILKENQNLSVNISTNKQSQKHRLRQKSVSFAENIATDNDSDSYSQYSIDDRNEIVRNAQTLADKILIASIDATAATKLETTDKLSNNSDDDFEQDFHQTIKPRRISINNVEELVYQDLSAEIVAYVLKHALRTLKKEQHELTINQNKQDEDFIDLK
ncbi:unnamed protein product [Rotaria sp. Silwood1]|nr:unnamed protein product [Rotaria sp. Silwood1]CAF3433315.1 unnamed protein product [Rotaria sp. Silwood1]CAF3479370.1 unnamed protein product [Rotaria sp. Silwood1]CAF3486760.1 unnamed protein product [Rotaria sp. Silwood1]CAF3495711.1 unnamed protein product [Rotaria sp. Silwood1]